MVSLIGGRREDAIEELEIGRTGKGVIGEGECSAVAGAEQVGGGSYSCWNSNRLANRSM